MCATATRWWAGDRLATEDTASGAVRDYAADPAEVLTAWIKHANLKPDSNRFPSRVHESPHLGTRQYARIVDGWVEEIGLDPTA
jgi:hypothetical protein